MSTKSILTTTRLATVGIVFASQLCAVAQDASWTNLSGNWSTPGNWNPNVPPGPGTNAFLTNNTGGTAYTVTNDVLNNTFADLTIFNPGNGAHILFNNQPSLNPTGDVILGQRATLLNNGGSFIVGGGLVISNLGTLRVIGGGTGLVTGVTENRGNLVVSNAASSLSLVGGLINTTPLNLANAGTLNIGGASAVLANSSSYTFTNSSTGSIDFRQGGATLNGSTTVIGIWNQGTIQIQAGANGYVNAAVFNDTNGVIKTSTSGGPLSFHSIPTNMGTINVGNVGVSIVVSNGNMVNLGTVRNSQGGTGGNFILANGSFLNYSNVFISGNGATWTALSTLNNGSMWITNAGLSGQTVNFGGPLTNNGSITIYKTAPLGSFGNFFVATHYVNAGSFTVVGTSAVFNADMTVAGTTTPTTNQATGSILLTNGAALALNGGFGNKGTVTILTNATLGIGSAQFQRSPIQATLGTAASRNEGTIIFDGGTLATENLTNAVTGLLQGHGDIGRVAFSNIVVGGVSNFVRQFFARNIRNEGIINLDGSLNAGVISNVAGGLITGFGSIHSLNGTNYVGGSVSNVNAGAQIRNLAGATILASGGTLVLSNGFLSNSQFGTLGASNGVLQLGDGTLALTNNGTLYVQNGGLHIGDLHNNGTAQIIDSVVTWSNTVVNDGRYISDLSTNTFLDDVTVLAAGTLEGGVGDLFDSKQNLFIHSTNTSFFDLVLSTVSFTGGGDHTNAITGLDLGGLPFGEMLGFTSTNFAYGGLRLGPTDNLYLTDGDGNGSNTNALYIGVLDIGGTTNNLTLLHTPFNIYYRNGIVGNEYLGGLTYSLDGGGFLIPVPEPTSLAFLLIAGLAIWRRR